MHDCKPHLYGRRKGPKLSQRQDELLRRLLPQLKIDIDPRNREPNLKPAQLFSNTLSDLWLEIGFGSGAHLFWQAQRHPDIGFIGCEPFINGLSKLLVLIDDAGLQNVRVYDNDARFLLDCLPPSSLGRVFLLFPDPWPKKRHFKRRFVSEDNLDRLARVMRSGADLRIASDIASYIQTILRCFHYHDAFIWLDDSAEDWRTRGPDWPETRYERKALNEGRKPAYLSFRRK